MQEQNFSAFILTWIRVRVSILQSLCSHTHTQRIGQATPCVSSEPQNPVPAAAGGKTAGEELDLKPGSSPMKTKVGPAWFTLFRRTGDPCRAASCLCATIDISSQTEASHRVRILVLYLRLALITSTTFNMLMFAKKTLQYLYGQGIIFLFEVSSNFLLLC